MSGYRDELASAEAKLARLEAELATLPEPPTHRGLWLLAASILALAVAVGFWSRHHREEIAPPKREPKAMHHLRLHAMNGSGVVATRIGEGDVDSIFVPLVDAGRSGLYLAALDGTTGKAIWQAGPFPEEHAALHLEYRRGRVVVMGERPYAVDWDSKIADSDIGPATETAEGELLVELREDQAEVRERSNGELLWEGSLYAPAGEPQPGATRFGRTNERLFYGYPVKPGVQLLAARNARDGGLRWHASAIADSFDALAVTTRRAYAVIGGTLHVYDAVKGNEELKIREVELLPTGDPG